jgi:putative transposase
VLFLTARERRPWIDTDHAQISVARQCELVGLPRSSFYYAPQRYGESAKNLALMKQIDRIYTRRPFYGSPRITEALRRQGQAVNEKRVARLMRVMGLQAIVPGPHTSQPHPENPVYPYLLRDLEVVRPDQVWASDITYLPMRAGYLYLVAIMDWFSRFVLAWELSNTLETEFCMRALSRALGLGRCPEIFNTDQGAQFTSQEFTGTLLSEGIRISMDGRGRAMDNVFVERLWRTVKYEEVYPSDYGDAAQAFRGIGKYFSFYNTDRPHQSLGNRTPREIYRANN